MAADDALIHAAVQAVRLLRIEALPLQDKRQWWRLAGEVEAMLERALAQRGVVVDEDLDWSGEGRRC